MHRVELAKQLGLLVYLPFKGIGPNGPELLGHIGPLISRYQLIGNRLHIAEHVNSLILIHEVRVLQVFLKRAAKHGLTGIRCLHFHFNASFKTIGQWLLEDNLIATR